jgi:hypothetical protein
MRALRETAEPFLLRHCNRPVPSKDVALHHLTVSGQQPETIKIVLLGEQPLMQQGIRRYLNFLPLHRFLFRRVVHRTRIAETNPVTR